MVKSNLKRIRAERGLSLQKIAEETGLSYPTIQKIDVGNVEDLAKTQLETYLKITTYLGISLLELLTETGNASQSISILKEYKSGRLSEEEVLKLLQHQ